MQPIVDSTERRCTGQDSKTTLLEPRLQRMSNLWDSPDAPRCGVVMRRGDGFSALKRTENPATMGETTLGILGIWVRLKPMNETQRDTGRWHRT